MREITEFERVEIFTVVPSPFPAGGELLADPSEAASAVSAQVDFMGYHDPSLTDLLSREKLRQAWIEAARAAAKNGGAVIRFAAD